MGVFFTSDPHFFHANVIRYCNRPYATVEEMNEALIGNWNSVVGPDDTVYCLGDFSLAIRPVEIYSSRLQGHKKLIPGNHDWCHAAHKKSKNPDKLARWVAKYQEHGWEVLPIHSQLDIPGEAKINLCHMPYKGDSTDDRYQQYRMVDDGRVLICGHVHQHWLTKRTPQGTLMVNVGVDVRNYVPISQEDLLKIIASEQENK